MHEQIYEELKRVAQRERTTTYGEVAPLAGLDMSNPGDRNRIASILDEINEYELGNGRPMLSAVVVLVGEGMPGQGFFTMAKRVGLYSGDDDVAFYARELTRVFDAWRGSDAGRDK